MKPEMLIPHLYLDEEKQSYTGLIQMRIESDYYTIELTIHDRRFKRKPAKKFVCSSLTRASLKDFFAVIYYSDYLGDDLHPNIKKTFLRKMPYNIILYSFKNEDKKIKMQILFYEDKK